jgi:hypothetical protein
MNRELGIVIVQLGFVSPYGQDLSFSIRQQEASVGE